MNAIIIPAYNPDIKLETLVDQLISLSFQHIIVVNDGSSESSSKIFDNIKTKGCIVLSHLQNKGKGAALKTGIEYVSHNYPNLVGYVTCDADGQHAIEDIQHVSNVLLEHPTSLILGSRDLTTKDVPFKSRFGNRFSSVYFKIVTGITCKDTQTGLRGIPMNLSKSLLQIKENRYDFEMAFLIQTAQGNTPIIDIPIATIYEEQNRSSHFRPVMDSLRIYKEPIKFALSSLICAIVDLSVFTILVYILDQHIVILVLIATVSARILSGILNFVLNRIWSFRNFNSIKEQFKKYFALYIVILTLSFLFVTLLSFIPVNLTIIKLIVDTILFISSFIVQKKWVFKHTKQKTL